MAALCPDRRFRPAILAVAAVAAVCAFVAPSPSAARAAQPPSPAISVEGSRLLRNGAPWTPRGVQIVGLVAPDNALRGKYVAAHAQFGPGELGAAVADHADLVRFQVSEFGLDPQGPLYSPAYVQEVVGAVQEARSLGLAVIVSLQAQPPAGEPERCGLPDAGAERAWNNIAPMFAGDRGVMFELYNEPGVAATPAGWIQWRSGGLVIYPGGSCLAIGMQALISDIRTRAPDNVLIVPGLAAEQSLAGRYPLTDPAHRRDPQLAYGVHYPTLSRGSTAWDQMFGNASASVPVIVTEFNGNSTTNCVPNTPAVAQLLMNYLVSKQIGIVGFAFDLPGTIVQDSSYTPSTFVGFACGVPGGGTGQLLFGDFAAEAQAGDGTQPDPAPAWIVSGGVLNRLATLDRSTALHFFNTPRTFVTGTTPASLAALGMGTAVAAASFTNETNLAAALTDNAVAPGTGAVVYAPRDTRATPLVQQRHLAQYYRQAAEIAHQHGMLLIAAPALGLAAAQAPSTPEANQPAAFLRLRIAATAAQYADVFAAPAAPTAQPYPASFASFARTAAAQAARAHPSVELLAGLTAAAKPSRTAANALFDDYLGTRLQVSGYALDDRGPANPCAGCARAASDTGLTFLRRLQRLG